MTDTPETSDFPPVPLRFRHDGWTPARQWSFIQKLADTGSVEQAAHAVMMSESSAYRLRRHPDAGDFRRAWDAALDQAWSQLSQLVFERIRYGETKTIEHKDGGCTTIRTPCSDRLLISALKFDERRRERAEARAAAQAAVAEARAAAAPADWPARPGVAAAAAPDAGPGGDIAARAEDAACAALHRLAAGLTDKPGWEGPSQPPIGEVPLLPMAPRHLAPASISLATRAGKARWRTGTAAVAGSGRTHPLPGALRHPSPSRGEGKTGGDLAELR